MTFIGPPMGVAHMANMRMAACNMARTPVLCLLPSTICEKNRICKLGAQLKQPGDGLAGIETDDGRQRAELDHVDPALAALDPLHPHIVLTELGGHILLS